MDYFLYLNNERRGPFTVSQLQGMWKTGSITKETLFWMEGLGDWQPLSNIVNLLEPQPVTANSIGRDANKATKKKKTGCAWLAVCAFVIFLIIGYFVSSDHTTSGKAAVKAKAVASQFTVEVTNLDSFDWPLVTLYANGNPLTGYKYEYPYTVAAGSTITVNLNAFAHDEKRFNPLTTKVTQIIVHVPGYDAPILGFN